MLQGCYRPYGIFCGLPAVFSGGREGAKKMKQGIHPENKLITVKCICGSEFQTISQRDAIGVEVCSQCHPFFTGQKRVVDTAGRVERFVNRAGRAGGAATYGSKAAQKGKK
jgi:large subunit ribosomal protein L31